MDKRAEGNYNKIESHHKHRDDPRSRWQNLIGLFSATKQEQKNSYNKEVYYGRQTKQARQASQPTKTNNSQSDRVSKPETIPHPQDSWIDFYTETSETDIYSKIVKQEESTGIINTDFCIDLSTADDYTEIPQQILEEAEREKQNYIGNTTNGVEKPTFNDNITALCLLILWIVSYFTILIIINFMA